ncbi:MAG: hypothetical protein ACI31I_04250 [Bacilli bacterium]
MFKNAIYCRLSLDDGSLGESGSIQTYASQVAKVGRMMGQYSHISNGLTLDTLRFITSWFLF